MINQFFIFFKKPRFYITTLVFLTFFLSILKTIHTTDIHHWEMILFSAKNAFNLVPFQERYEQYGLLLPYLLSPLNIFGDFTSKFFTGLLFSLIFSLHLYMVFLVSRHFLSSSQSILITLIFFLISPRLQYPWPDYLAALFLLFFIYFLVIKESKFSWIPLTLVFLIREATIIPGITSLILVIITNIIFDRRLWFELKQIIYALIFHLIIILFFLAFSNTYTEFFSQIFNFSFWQDTPQPIQERFFSRFFGLLSVSNLSVKLMFFNLIFASFLALFYFLLALKKVELFNKKFILLFIFSSVFSIMTIHIPETYRFQIYTFMSLVFIIIIFNNYNFSRFIALPYLLLNLIIFSYSGFSITSKMPPPRKFN